MSYARVLSGGSGAAGSTGGGGVDMHDNHWKRKDLHMARILAERRARRLEPVKLPEGSKPRAGLEPIP